MSGRTAVPQTFAALLAECLSRLGLSQSALAECIGVDHSHISRLVNRNRRPSRACAGAIAEVIGRNLGEGMRDRLLLAGGWTPPGLLDDPELREMVELVAAGYVPQEMRPALLAVLQAEARRARRHAASTPARVVEAARA